MKGYNRYECRCGWFCYILGSIKVAVFHCGAKLTRTPGGEGGKKQSEV